MAAPRRKPRSWRISSRKNSRRRCSTKTDLDAQNQIIKDKDVEGTKPKKRTDKPSNFVSNKDFNPGSWLRLLNLPEEQNNFYTEFL